MTSNNETTINTGTRLAAMLLDHIFMTLIAGAFLLPPMISDMFANFTPSHEPTDFDFWGGSTMYLGMFGFALYFCKDIINGRSIAKRILKLQVVDNRTGRVATPIQCLIRNILCVFWFVEVFVAMTNTNRRLGDRIAGTRLVVFNPTLEQPKFNFGKLILTIVISYGILLLFFQMTPSVKVPSPIYSKTSYNETESNRLKKVLTDSLGEFAVPDIKIYDSLQNQNLKYISIILKLKANYIASNDDYNLLHEKTTNLIYTIHPKESFTGQIKYIYQNAGQFTSKSTTIGILIQPRNDK
jgi:uncharacterized RDD family membrane protein YckC